MSNGRVLLVSSDNAIIKAVTSALDMAASLLQIDHLSEDDAHIQDKFQPSGIIIDSDGSSGVQSAFERIAAARRQFPAIPVIALGNEMSAQLVLAALRAGADDFVDRDAPPEQLQQAINSCLAQGAKPRLECRARIAAILSALPSEQDQDFALNLAVRTAMRAQGAMVLYIDLSLPATQAGIALGLDLKFGLQEAIREISRLDRALLESAVARDERSGLYVMALSNEFGGEGVALEAAGFGALLQVLRSIFDTIIIHYGPFSRQAALLEMVQASATFFLCCSQRFSSIRGAGDMLRWLADTGIVPAPELVVHEMAPGQTPTPADIRKVLHLPVSIDVGGSWDELTGHLNDGAPMALAPSSRYGRGLDTCLERMGMALPPEPDMARRLRRWLHLDEARP